jgi:hypothetical protein
VENCYALQQKGAKQEVRCRRLPNEEIRRFARSSGRNVQNKKFEAGERLKSGISAEPRRAFSGGAQRRNSPFCTFLPKTERPGVFAYTRVVGWKLLKENPSLVIRA